MPLHVFQQALTPILPCMHPYLGCFGQHDALSLTAIVRLYYVRLVLLRSVVRHELAVTEAEI